MKKFGIVFLLFGIMLLAFPAEIGGLVIGSFAFFIAVPALVAFVFSLLRRNVLAAVLSMLFLLTAGRVLFRPSLLLSYIGTALMISSVVQFVMVRRSEVLITSGITGVLGLLAVYNSNASLRITAIILGIVIVGMGILLISVESTVVKSFGYTPHPPKKRIDILVDDCEEADFKDIP